MTADSRDSARLFDETAVHEAPRKKPSELTRIRETVALIPPDAFSLLDVGCGRGDLLHEIDLPLTVGTDLARRGIRYVRRPAAVSSMLELPFADRSFDVVLCAETLEHLDPADLERAAAELRRVARSWVLVTVPFDENLLETSHRCPACGTVFHLYGHRSTFTPERLRSLFPGAANYEVRGAWPVRPWNPALLRFRTQRLGLWKYSEYTKCPVCGHTGFENAEQRPGYRLLDLLNDLVNPRRSRFRWLLLRIDVRSGQPAR